MYLDMYLDTHPEVSIHAGLPRSYTITTVDDTISVVFSALDRSNMIRIKLDRKYSVTMQPVNDPRPRRRHNQKAQLGRSPRSSESRAVIFRYRLI